MSAPSAVALSPVASKARAPLWNKERDVRLLEHILATKDIARAWDKTTADALMPRAPNGSLDDTIRLHKARLYNIRDKMWKRANKREPTSYQELLEFVKNRDYEAARARRNTKKRAKRARKNDESVLEFRGDDSDEDEDGEEEEEEESTSSGGSVQVIGSTTTTTANNVADYPTKRQRDMRALLEHVTLRETFDLYDPQTNKTSPVDAKHTDAVLEGKLVLKIRDPLAKIQLVKQSLYEMIKNSPIGSMLPNYAAKLADDNKALVEMLGNMRVPLFFIGYDLVAGTNNNKEFRFNKTVLSWSLMVYAGEERTQSCAALMVLHRNWQSNDVRYEIVAPAAIQLFISGSAGQNPQMCTSTRGSFVLPSTLRIGTRNGNCIVHFMYDPSQKSQ